MFLIVVFWWFFFFGGVFKFSEELEFHAAKSSQRVEPSARSMFGSHYVSQGNLEQ